jgi:hypothetical protein
MLLAIVALAGAAAATSADGLRDHYPEWQGSKGLIDTLGWVVLAGAIACELALVAPRLKRIFGLIERFFIASVIVWLSIISSELIRFGRRRPGPRVWGNPPAIFIARRRSPIINSIPERYLAGTQRLNSDTSAPNPGLRNVDDDELQRYTTRRFGTGRRLQCSRCGSGTSDRGPAPARG